MEYFYNGCKVKVVDANRHAYTHVKVLKNYSADKTINTGAEFIVSDSQLQLLCDQVYSIGDSIRSKLPLYKLKQNFVGVVVGFEYATNRVICDNKAQARVRYSYGIDEIEPHPLVQPMFEFKAGQWYSINDNLKSAKYVTAITIPGDPTYVSLICEDGISIAQVPRKTTLSNLMLNYQIYNIRVLHD